MNDTSNVTARIAYDDLPPGPYHKCGDCTCGKKNGANTAPENGHDAPPANGDDLPPPNGDDEGGPAAE